MQEIDGDWDGQDGALKIKGDKPTVKFVSGPIAGEQSWILHAGKGNVPATFASLRRTRIRVLEAGHRNKRDRQYGDRSFKSD